MPLVEHGRERLRDRGCADRRSGWSAVVRDWACEGCCGSPEKGEEASPLASDGVGLWLQSVAPDEGIGGSALRDDERRRPKDSCRTIALGIRRPFNWGGVCAVEEAWRNLSGRPLFLVSIACEWTNFL